MKRETEGHSKKGDRWKKGRFADGRRFVNHKSADSPSGRDAQCRWAAVAMLESISGGGFLVAWSLSVVGLGAALAPGPLEWPLECPGLLLVAPQAS